MGGPVLKTDPFAKSQKNSGVTSVQDMNLGYLNVGNGFTQYSRESNRIDNICLVHTLMILVSELKFRGKGTPFKTLDKFHIYIYEPICTN